MKKKIYTLLLTGAMVLALAACSSKEEATETTATELTTEEKVNLKVGLVTDTSGVNDSSFNQSAWQGITRAVEKYGIDAKYIESATEEDFIPNIESFVDDDYDFIICAGYSMADAVREEAEVNPEVRFAIIDTDEVEANNVASIIFEQSESSYLAGYVAGLTTKTNVVGFVLGESTPTMNEFGYGFTAGVLDANPNATVLQSNINNFYDIAAGKDAANLMVQQGADIIFHAAGASGLGVIDACKEAGIWAIGADEDQSNIAPETILTSAMKRVDNACYFEIKSLVDGTFVAGAKTYSLANEGVGLAPTVDNLDPEVLDQVNEVKGNILNGTITVPKNKKTFEKQHGAGVYTLE